MKPRRRTLLAVTTNVRSFCTWAALASTAAIILAGAASAQTTPVLAINQAPSSRPVWSTLQPGLSIDDLQFRIQGTEGGWTLLGLEPDVPNGPPWLRVAPPTVLNTYADIVGDDGLVKLHPEVFRFYSGLGIRDFLTRTPGGNNVRSWYAPLLLNQPQRVWRSDPPAWSSPSATYGSVSRDFWEAMNVGFATGTIEDTTRFRTEQIFRWSVFLRATQIYGLPSSVVDQYFQSAEYASAVYGPNGPFFGVSVQPIWLGSPSGINDPPRSDDAAPPLDLPPLARIGDDILIPFRLPKSIINSGYIVELLGAVRPNEVRYFTATNLLPPLQIEFPKQGGGTTIARGLSAVHRGNVLQYVTTIPGDVALGDILLSDRRGLPPFKVGEVTDVLPQ